VPLSAASLFAMDGEKERIAEFGIACRKICHTSLDKRMDGYTELRLLRDKRTFDDVVERLTQRCC
jgi:hypothetical protein